MREKGVKAARLYPGRAHHGFTLADWCAGGLLDALDAARMPLLLDIESVSWEDVYALLKRYQRLPIVVSNCSYRHNRYLYPLWERFGNLYVETCRFLGAGTIEDVVRRFGAGHLLFGSNMPVYTGTAIVARITYADISREDKEAIASGNLKRLLEEL
jgi:predicted TIM-barrel fold metal-dependent hydrolase